jgi:hypothetical protein
MPLNRPLGRGIFLPNWGDHKTCRDENEVTAPLATIEKLGFHNIARP